MQICIVLHDTENVIAVLEICIACKNVSKTVNLALDYYSINYIQ